ncbi:MAG: M56 family metallopeptidase [Mucilaginibacter sp.]
MIAYILKSAICLTVLLAVYHVLLEKKKMHRFNRFYLLLSLVIGMILPVLTIKISSGALNDTPLLSKALAVQQTPLLVQSEVSENGPVQHNPLLYNPEPLLIVFYALITGVLAARFVGNLITINSRVYKNPRLKLNEASLVLLPNEVVPHSFLGYIFLNEHDYREGRVEGQLLEHELTHVRQMHSLDILFIEILTILFWFNPIFIFYKKAIQLNHEFLADEAVLSTYEVSEYQYLLLERSIITTSVPLTSNLNYSLTKKRLTMMIKTTSKLKIWTARLAVIPVLVAMLFLFSMKSISEVHKFKPTALDNLPKKEEDFQKEVFFKGATIWIENKDGKFMPRKYDEMTAAEKAALPAPNVPKKLPTDEILSAWETQPDVYAICIDGKYANNAALANYKPNDFVLYCVRKPGKIDLAVNKNYGKASHLVDLRTTSYYTEKYIKPYIKPGKWLAVYQRKIWPGGFDGSEMIHKYFEVEQLKKENPKYDKRWALPPFKPEKIE